MGEGLWTACASLALLASATAPSFTMSGLTRAPWQRYGRSDKKNLVPFGARAEFNQQGKYKLVSIHNVSLPSPLYK